MRTLQAIGQANDKQTLHLNWEYSEVDVNNGGFGIQCFVYKKVVGDVAVSQGSPVGAKAASGGGEVTADQSVAGAIGAVGHGGGISTIAVGAGQTKYGFVQHKGINRYAALAGAGTITAGSAVVWSGDDTLNDMTAGQEHLVIGRALVGKDTANKIPAGGLLLL